MRNPGEPRPKRIEQADAAFEPIKDLLERLRKRVLPQIAEQDPTSRKVMLEELEADLSAAFQALDDLESEAHEIEGDVRKLRRSFADLRRDGRRLLRQPSRPLKQAAKEGPARPTQQAEQDKDRVYAALPSDGRARTTYDLFVVTGFGFAKLRRILRILEKEDAVERTGFGPGTRYRVRWPRG